MKLLALFVGSLALASGALLAGPMGSPSHGGYGKAPSYGGGAGKGPAYGKGPAITPVVPTLTLGNCDDCFAPGNTDFSIYAAGITPDDDGGVLDDGIGGGVAISHWYSRFFGTELSATWFDNHSVIHSVQGSVVARYPIPGTCLAPYILAGVGYHANSVSQETYHYGGGIDWRFNSGCTGLFIDAVQTVADDSGDYTVWRAGLRQSW